MNGQHDQYEVFVETDRVIMVEDILTAIAEFSKKPILQEQFTVSLSERLGTNVRTIGWHSGVRTEVFV